MHNNGLPAGTADVAKKPAFCKGAPMEGRISFRHELSADGIAAVRRREAVSARGREVGGQPSCSYGVRRRVPGISSDYPRNILG